MSPKYSNTKIHHFIKTFVESKEGQIVDQSDEVFTINYPNAKEAKEYTYQPALAKEKKIPLITAGSPALREIINECLEHGVLCQISLKPKGTVQSLVKKFYKDAPFDCDACDQVVDGQRTMGVCIKSPPCYHQINNAKITSIKVVKREPVRYFRFYFSATFQNKLRPKTEERIAILVDQDGQIVDWNNLDEDVLLENSALYIQDFDGAIEPELFDKLKATAYTKLDYILKEKLIFFDLMLSKEIKSKLRSFDKRLKGERREKVISRKHDFDAAQWQASYEALLKREEESFITNIAVKFLNLLVINTTKISFAISLDNNSVVSSSFVLGVSTPTELVCSDCGKPFFEGYATQDARYVCQACIKQSVDTGKIYSTQQALTLDTTLNEYIETDEGFICSVCGERKSWLLEFKCNHDGSSVCIHHYGLCGVCGKTFSQQNLSASKESKRTLCPVHSAKCDMCGQVIAVDEGKLCKATGKRFCSSCASFAKCTSCQQEYFTQSLIGDKCPACRSLEATTDEPLIAIIQAYDVSQRKTTKWLIGKNALNAVIVTKGMFSNILYVVEDGKVTYQRSISFLQKFRGH